MNLHIHVTFANKRDNRQIAAGAPGMTSTYALAVSLPQAITASISVITLPGV